MSSINYQYPLNKVERYTSFRELITKAGEKYVDKPAFIYQTNEDEPLTKVTYQEWRDQVMTGSAGLSELLKLSSQRREGKKIALIAPNSYTWVLAYFSIVNLNQVVVPLDWQLPVRDLINSLQKANVSAVIFAPEVAEKIAEIKMANLKIRHFISLTENEQATTAWSEIMTEGKKVLEENKNFAKEWPVYPEALSTIMFTSGTTSSPKGVMLTQSGLLANTMGIAQLLDLNDEVLLSVLPLFHAYEFTAGTLTQLYCGSTIYYLPGGLHKFAENLQKVKPTLLFLVPLVVEGCYTRIVQTLPKDCEQKIINKVTKKYFGGRLRKIIVGGAPLNPEVADRFEEMKTKIIQGYGASENSPVIATGRDRANKHASVGFPLPNSKVKIEQPNEDGVGEILVHGPSVMLGYYCDEKKTNEALTDGWLHTGDYGYFDKEGFLYLAGRKKNVIIGKNAKNIYPEELEFLLNNTEGIVESMVYGEITNDDVQVAALIVPDEKKVAEVLQTDNKTFDHDQLCSFIRKQIRKINQSNVHYKEIKKWRLVTGLSKNATGKIRRQEAVDKSGECVIMETGEN